MKLKIETKNIRNLSNKEIDLMNKIRVREWGSKEARSKKDFPNTIFFFLKDDGKIMAFGGLRYITINYQGKNYKILGLCSILSVKKGKGYGKILVKAMIKHLKKTGKTGLGFCGKKITGFYKKSGLNTKKDLIRRFVYKNPKTGKEVIDNEGDGLYYEGKDQFMKKVLSTKQIVYINTPHW